MIISNSIVLSQEQQIWLNPGIKLGYQFGEENGFVFGFELSAVWENDGHASGGVLIDIDLCNKADLIRLNVAIEGHPFPFAHFPTGISVGPSIIFHDSNYYFGITTIAYVPFIGFIPYIGSTFSFDYSPVFETGSYIKYPILISGRGFRGFGG